MPDKMGITFTPEEIDDMTDHFNGILAIMNAKKVVQLTAEERKGAQSASETRIPYIQQAIEILAPDFVNLQPGFLSLADATNDWEATSELRALAALRAEVNDRMTDFAMASEHFAYQYMRVFYSNAKQALAVSTPGADTVVDALSPLFEGQGDSGNPTPNP